ncbi:hypothetical protein [Vibrio hyugaensis]|uniref:hypothetical protein n=1 Tax=Vibrio hyugaensis TaxID=1534743 RepID=UPI0012E0788B|nr:hypothetical protein [Vibrio hyugaensis]
MKDLSKEELKTVYGGRATNNIPLSPPPIPGAIHIDIKPGKPSLPQTIPNPWIIF